MGGPDPEPHRSAPADAVVARDLTLAYRDHVALAAATFSVPAGTVTAIIGPNGSGKSTLLDAIAGLRRPAAGHIDVLGGRPERAGRRVAYVLQATEVNAMLPVTVREVVTMGRYAHTGARRVLRRRDRAAVDAALGQLEIEDLAHRHLRELSGGQRQRVFVAQGLAQEADLLLLDEPITGLDLTSGGRILAAIDRARAASHTAVFTTHDLGEARRADRVVLVAGRVVAAGPPDEVLTADHLAAAYRGRVIQLDGNRLLLDDAAHTHDDEGHHDHSTPAP